MRSKRAKQLRKIALMMFHTGEKVEGLTIRHIYHNLKKRYKAHVKAGQ